MKVSLASGHHVWNLDIVTFKVTMSRFLHLKSYKFE